MAQQLVEVDCKSGSGAALFCQQLGLFAPGVWRPDPLKGKAGLFILSVFLTPGAPMMVQCPTYPRQTLTADTLNLAIGRAAQAPALDPMRVLQAVNQLAPSVAPGSWVALGLDTYFGPGTADLRFKEMLLPFVWVARQQLIARVGAAYQQVAVRTRSSLEEELLATLNALCVQGLRTDETGPARSPHSDLPRLPQPDLGDDYCRRGWQVFGRAYPQLAAALAETLVAWVSSMVKQLSDDTNWSYSPTGW